VKPFHHVAALKNCFVRSMFAAWSLSDSLGYPYGPDIIQPATVPEHHDPGPTVSRGVPVQLAAQQPP
jgi:hypothetical protein